MLQDLKLFQSHLLETIIIKIANITSKRPNPKVEINI